MLLGEEDDWGEDMNEEDKELPDYTGDWPSGDDALLDGGETEGVSNARGTVLLGHWFLPAPCKEALQTVDCQVVGGMNHPTRSSPP